MAFCRQRDSAVRFSKAVLTSFGDGKNRMSVCNGPQTVLEAQQADLSVVIPSVNGWSDLQVCLQALSDQSGDYKIEIIVADRIGEEVRAPLRLKYPQVHVLHATAEVSIPQLRAMAFREARGEIVAVIEDHVIVPADWAQKMLAAHQEGAMIVGGSVDNAARDRLVDWAAFLCEYSHCLAPPAGPAKWLAGNNVSYRQSLLERFCDAIGQERWEDHLHNTMRRAGVTLESRPDIRVGHKKHYTIAEYLFQRYVYARSYAGMKVQRAGIFQRFIYGLATLALPMLLIFRIVARVLRAGRYRRELVTSLPLLALFVSAWAVGEAIGYWMGSGDALRKVR